MTETPSFPDDFYSIPPDPSPAAEPTEEQPRRLGDYDLTRKLGEGGMGVVYLAHQRSADRTVALKLIRPEMLSALSYERQKTVIERFRVEARAAAQLDHDNIVTVHDVGEVDGQYFFSMRYVDGLSLADKLKDGPLDGHVAAFHIEAISRAVHEAHERGVLHRDLKPANVLIDDNSNRALVADFGLAKLSEDQTELTRSGEVMGTPQYMSPEQAKDSSAVSRQSDVYSLGATLYHLLTGRPAFQAATPLETLRQVLEAEPVAPRQLNPAIGRDLDTICLKCLEKEPARRYATAEELADELQRFLSGEPILARPINAVGRVWRWSKRNRLAASLILTVFISLITALTTVSIALVKVSKAKAQAERSFQDAFEMVNAWFTRVSEETLLDEPGLQPLRQDLLLMARDYYENKFLAQRSDDPTIKVQLAQTYYYVGRITAEIESPERALAYYEKSLATHRSFPELSITQHVALANTINAQGEAEFHLGQYAESLRSFESSRVRREDLRKRLVAEVKKVRKRLKNLPHSLSQTESLLSVVFNEAHRQLANAYMNIGAVKRAKAAEGEPATDSELNDVLKDFRQAQAIREDVPAEQRTEKLKRDLAKGEYNIAEILDQQNNLVAAEKGYMKAIERFDELLKSGMKEDYIRAQCFHRIAGTQDEDQIAKTMEYLSKAREQMRGLASRNPRVDNFQTFLASINLEFADCALEADGEEPSKKAIANSKEAIEEARDLYEKLVAKNPSVVNHQDSLVVAVDMLSAVENLGKPEEAQRKRLIELFQELVDRFPQIERFKRELDAQKE